MKPLLIPEMDGDLLRLIRRSNEFEYYLGAEPIRLGDVLYTTSYIEGITIEEEVKSMRIVAQIRRHETPVVQVTCIFRFWGTFSDYEDTFRCTDEPEMEVEIPTSQPRVARRLGGGPLYYWEHRCLQTSNCHHIRQFDLTQQSSGHRPSIYLKQRWSDGETWESHFQK